MTQETLEITATPRPANGSEARPSLYESLEYEAPFLIEKLLKEKIVDTAEEGERLFREMKRYFILVETDYPKLWEMYSLRIDTVWHEFVLFTHEYMKFCSRYYGRYLPHSPSNAPIPEGLATLEVGSFEEFRVRYEEAYGEPLPDLWYDANSVTVNRRVVNDHVGYWTLQRNGEMVDLVMDSGGVLLSVNEFAHEALAFILQTGAFYVRELPGDLDNEEKVVLIATLVENNLLRVAS